MGLQREFVQIKPSTLEAFKKAGRVIVDGKELKVEEDLTPKM